MPTISIRDINIGGIAASKYQGSGNSVADIVNLDIHSEPGIIKLNKQTFRDGNSTAIDDILSAIVPATDLKAYLFAKNNGKIWKRSNDGSAASATYSLLCDIGTTNIETYNAFEAVGLNGSTLEPYIYYIHKTNSGGTTYIGRHRLAESDWSLRNDTWQALASSFYITGHIVEINGKIYIANDRYVSTIIDGVFTEKAFTLEQSYKVLNMAPFGDDLLVTYYKPGDATKTKILRWNRSAKDPIVIDFLPDYLVNSFLQFDNNTIFSAGLYGNLYYYDGSDAVKLRKIDLSLLSQYPTTDEKLKRPGKNSTAYWQGKSLFGMAGAIYSYGSFGAGYSPVLTREYLTSFGEPVSSATCPEIGAMAVVPDNSIDGDMALIYSCKLGSEYRVDRVNEKITNGHFSWGRFDTGVIRLDRQNAVNLFNISVPYRSIPTGASIQIYAKTNNGAWTELTSVNDTISQKYVSQVNIDDAYSVQFRCKLNSGDGYTPEIEGMEIDY